MVVLTAPTAAAIAALALAISTTGRSVPMSAQTQPTSAFRSAVDLLQLDVNVVNAAGYPVLNLGPENFEVTVGRRRRQVVATDFIQYQNPDLLLPVRASGPGPVASNQTPPANRLGRIFILSIDAASLSVPGTSGVVNAARGFVERLSPEDRVGLFTVPEGAVLSPTTDRHLVRQALSTVNGLASPLPGKFNLSPDEVVDIVAATGGRPPRRISTGTTPGVQRSSTEEELQDIITRACGSAVNAGCTRSVIDEGVAAGREMNQRLANSLAALDRLLLQLGAYSSKKVVVFLSASLGAGSGTGGSPDEGQSARLIGQQAVLSNSTLYAVHVSDGMSQRASVPRRITSRSRAGSERILSELVVPSGGRLLRVTDGFGEGALDEVLRETSAYYRIAVPLDQAERDGRLHPVSVKVRQSGATSRTAPWILLSSTPR